MKRKRCQKEKQKLFRSVVEWIVWMQCNVIILCCACDAVQCIELAHCYAIRHCLQLWSFHISVACSTACLNCKNTQRSVCCIDLPYSCMQTICFATRINTILTSGSRNHDLNLLSGAHHCHTQALDVYALKRYLCVKINYMICIQFI